MKSKTVLCIFFIISFTSVNAQFNAGLNGEFSVPTKDIGTIINFSSGGELFVGYTLNNILNFNLAYSYSYFNSQVIEFQSISGFSANVKLFITQADNRFYLGFGTGKYNMKFEGLAGYGTQNYVGWGIKPTVGMLFKAGFLENLSFNSSLSYLSYFEEINQDMISLNFGVVYYLNATH